MSSSYSEFKPASEKPGQRIQRNKMEVRRSERNQRLQQWATMGFIGLCLLLGGYLLISSEIQTRTPALDLAGPEAVDPGNTLMERDEVVAGDESSAPPVGAEKSIPAPDEDTVTVDLRDKTLEKPVPSTSTRPASPPESTETQGNRAASAASPVSGQASQGTATAVEPAAANETAPRSRTANTEVASAQFTYGMRGGAPGTPVDYVRSSALQDGILYFHSIVEGKPGTRVVHEWRHNGRVVETQQFRLSSQREVFVSSHALGPQAFGTYRVYVRDSSGAAVRVGSALFEPE